MALGGVSAAAAADLTPEPAPVAAPAPEGFNWTGFYIGVHGGIGGGPVKDTIGYGFFDGDEYFPAGTAATLDTNSFGGFGGAQVGYNYEFDNKIVVGAVADIAFANIKSKTDIGIPEIPASAGIDTTVDWFGTIRARVGYAVDNFLIYGTGGAAYGKVKTSINASLFGDPVLDYSSSSTKWGWTAGAGFEYALSKNVTLGTEYLYVDLGKSTFLDPTFIGFDDVGITGKSDVAFHTIKATLNYKF